MEERKYSRMVRKTHIYQTRWCEEEKKSEVLNASIKKNKDYKANRPEQGFLETNIKKYIKKEQNKSNKNNPQTGFLHD